MSSLQIRINRPARDLIQGHPFPVGARDPSLKAAEFLEHVSDISLFEGTVVWRGMWLRSEHRGRAWTVPAEPGLLEFEANKVEIDQYLLGSPAPGQQLLTAQRMGAMLARRMAAYSPGLVVRIVGHPPESAGGRWKITLTFATGKAAVDRYGHLPADAQVPTISMVRGVGCKLVEDAGHSVASLDIQSNARARVLAAPYPFLAELPSPIVNRSALSYSVNRIGRYRDIVTWKAARYSARRYKRDREQDKDRFWHERSSSEAILDGFLFRDRLGERHSTLLLEAFLEVGAVMGRRLTELASEVVIFTAVTEPHDGIQGRYFFNTFFTTGEGAIEEYEEMGLPHLYDQPTVSMVWRFE